MAEIVFNGVCLRVFAPPEAPPFGGYAAQRFTSAEGQQQRGEHEQWDVDEEAGSTSP